MSRKFAVFILTYGRANNLITTRTLRESGYTGKIYYLCSKDDKSLNEYKKKYKDDVIIFDKNDYKKTFDIGDNFKNDKVVVYARNANFGVAKKLGLDYFIQLDDDYNNFSFRIPEGEKLKHCKIRKLDKIFELYFKFLEKTDIKSVAFAQNGDYIGGVGAGILNTRGSKRKLMNFFFNKVDREYKFYGRVNEDVTCYVTNGSRGDVFMTMPFVSLNQLETQSNNGGLTDIYLEQGTYVKSFYSVLFNPSCIKVALMGNKNMRLHHRVKWKNAVPQIIREEHKKK